MRGDYCSRGQDKNSVRGNVGISGDGRSFSVERSRKEEDLGDGIEVKGRRAEESGNWKRRLVRVLKRPELRMRLGHSESRELACWYGALVTGCGDCERG